MPHGVVLLLCPGTGKLWLQLPSWPGAETGEGAVGFLPLRTGLLLKTPG